MRAFLKHTFLIGTFVLLPWFMLYKLTEAKEVLTFSPKIIPITMKFPPNLDRLSYAVSCAETSCGKDGTALRRRNLHGIMCFKKDGTRYPCYFDSAADSHAAFKKLWSKPTGYYKGQMPDLRLATTWVCGPRTPTGKACGINGVDDPKNWLKNVQYAYYSL